MKKVFAVCLSCVVLTAGTLSLMTHASEDFREALFEISPQAAAMFNPVMKSSIKNGIEMTVEGVYIHDDDAEFYITLRDTEGSRIDQTVDLYDSYEITRAFVFDGSAYGCAKEDYDENTGKIRFHIYTHEPGAGKFWGDSLIFSVRTILVGMERQKNVPMNIDLTEVNYHPETISGTELFSDKGHGSGGSWKVIPQLDELNFMKPEYEKEFLKEIKLTGVSWENGYLHIQNCVENWNGNSGISYYLEDENGNRLENFSYNWKDGNKEYMESFFAVAPENLKHYNVYADYWIGGELIDGNWNVKFPLA